MGRKHYKQIIGNTKKLQCIALGGRCPINVNGGAGDGNRTATVGQKLCNAGGRGGNVGGIRPMLSNWQLGSTIITEGANHLTVGASMLTPLTGSARIYNFLGRIDAVIGKGANVIADFGFDMDVIANEQFLIRCGAQVSTSGYTIVGGNLPASSSYDLSKSHTDSVKPADELSNWGGRINDNSSIGSYSPTDGANALFPFTPSIILGYSETPQPAVFVVGDSNAYGTGDASNGDGQGAIGYIERGLRTTASGVTAGSLWVRSGATLGLYNVGNAAKLFEAAEYHTHFLQQISGNSIGAGSTLASMKQSLVRAWAQAKIRNLRVIQIASLPRTTSSANTTVATNWEVGGLFDQLNSWMASAVGQKLDIDGNVSASGTVYLDYFWNCNDLLQDPATNLWLSATYTSDGTHLSATGAALAATRIATLANTLTVY